MKKLIALLLVLSCVLFACGDIAEFTLSVDQIPGVVPHQSTTQSTPEISFDLDNIPEFSGDPFVVINDNIPNFTEKELTTKSYEFYSDLDSLGRCGVTIASVGKDIMPTDKRGDISSVKPSGWINVPYDSSLVDGEYLYNRCHLLGFQLTGENANEKNLITGTRYMNVDGMLPFENMVADYVKETGNHVALRVTPIFKGEELVARGVQMEAFSVEDEGEGVCYNVFCYNVQPGIIIDYSTGKSRLDPDYNKNEAGSEKGEKQEYVLNTSSKKFHKPDCSSVSDMKKSNRKDVVTTREELISDGYAPCGSCKP